MITKKRRKKVKQDGESLKQLDSDNLVSDESKTEEKKNNNGKTVIKVTNGHGKLAMILLIIILVLLLGVTFKKMYDYKTDLKKEKSMVTTKVEFKNVGKLVTQTANVTVVKNYHDSREFLKLFDIPFTEYVLIFSYDFTVDAYVDFTKIHYTEKDNSFIVEIPHAECEDATIIESSKYKYYDNKNIFNSVDFDKSDEIRAEMKEKAQRDALNKGLLEKAEKNAELVISNMLKSEEKYKDYSVEFNYIGG